MIHTTGSHTSLRTRSLIPRLALLAFAIAAVFLGLQARVSPTYALAIVVNDLDDVADTDDGNANGFLDGGEVADGICDAPAADACTLRAAVFEANANGDTADTITFDASLSGTIALGSTLPLGDCGTILAASCGANLVVDNTTINGRVVGTSRVITVDCAGGPGVAFTVTGATNTVRDLNIVGCGTAAILIDEEPADSNRVLGNYIGTDVTGTACVSGNDTGVIIDSGADSNLIGDTAAADRNVISCNTSYGVRISSSGTTSNVVRNNYIGTNRTGSAALPNGTGVFDTSSTSNNIEGNLISGNNFEGIDTTSSGGSITGNTIGLQAGGSTPLGNGGSGVELDGASGYTIGGTTAAARNVISSNAFHGIILTSAAASNTIAGNYIGTDSTGNSPLGNLSNGLEIRDTANGNTIGGLRTDPVGCSVGPCNVISGNTQNGVRISDSASNNDVRGNNIGIGADGLAIVGNGIYGVFDDSTGANRVGGTLGTVAGTCLGVCNRIAHNLLAGVAVFADKNTATLIRRNEIFSNAGLGIDLDEDGVDCPPESGPPTANNNFPACPHILSAVYGGATWSVSGNDGGTAGAPDVPAGSPVDIYEVRADPSGYGEGWRWLATTTTDGSGNWTAPAVCVSGPNTLTANITHVATARSSEFGPNFDIVGTGSCVLTPPATATLTPLPPTNTPPATNTSVPPLATNTPTRTPTPAATSTTVPPTATSTGTVTAVPPTNTTVPPTNTSVPATNTAVPPTATRTSTPVVPPATATTVPSKLCGDVNDNGTVNAIDATLILQLTAALVDSLVNEPSGDVNNNGQLNPVDSALILQRVANLIPVSALVCPA